MAYLDHLTAELRTKVQELTLRPDGDFCADLAAWLLATWPQLDPDTRRMELREAALVKRQRDDAWRRLTVLERETHGLRKQLDARG